MANLSKFHVVFSSSTLIRLDKDAFEGHLCQTVNNFVKQYKSSLMSSLRKRCPTQHIKHIRNTRVSRIPTFDEPCSSHNREEGKKGCNKGASCQYAHPKLCRASLTSKRCDRRNFYYYHVAGTLRPLTDVVPQKNRLVQDLSLLCRWRSLPHQIFYLLHMDRILFQIMPFIICLQSHKSLYPMDHKSMHHQMSQQFF